MDENVRPGYQSIQATFKVKTDARAEQLKDLLQFSPVFNSMSQPVNIDATVETVHA